MRSRRTEPLEVLVRCARASAFNMEGRAKQAIAVLDPLERRRLHRMRGREIRGDYLAAHALARVTLGELGRCSPEKLSFGVSPLGRPEVTHPRRARALQFSLSHADGLVLCAVARGCPVGADVESHRMLGADPLGVAAAICSEVEHKHLRGLPLGLRARCILELWAKKEAVAKATGRGEYLSLAAIELDVGACSALSGRSTHHAKAGDGSAWRVTCMHLAPHHVAAIAVPAEVARDATYTYEMTALDRALEARASA